MRRIGCSCGKSRARATGRKAERKDSDGARMVAIAIGDGRGCREV